MVLCAVIAIAVQSQAARLLDDVVKGERLRPAQSVHIEVAGNVSGGTYDLQFIRPAVARLAMVQRGPSPSSRTYFVKGSQLTAYDKLANEVLTRHLASSSNLRVRMTEALGDLDPAVAVVLDPDALAAFLGDFRKLDGWKRASVDRLISLKRTAFQNGATSHIELSFDATTLLPRSVLLSAGPKSLHWSFTYGPEPSRVTLEVPPSALKVPSFVVHPAQPRYVSEDARQALQASIAAYRRVSSLFMRAEGEEPGTLYWQVGKARQEQTGIEWAYDGRTLSIIDRKGKRYFSGDARLGRIVDVIGTLGTRVDPLLRILLTGRNPIEVLFAPQMTAQMVGHISVGGAPSDIVELSGRSIRIQIQIRKDTHLVAGFITENLSPTGAVVSRSDRTFSYPIEKRRMTAQTFRLSAPPGFSSLPLPDVPNPKAR